jgi:hypothetical protein
MAAEAGHATNRVYTDQAGNLHLNGASVFDANEVDQKAALNSPVAGVAAGYKVARGQLTTVTAADTVVTGLATVVAVVACLDDNPGDNPMLVSATIGDQAGTPAAGSVIIKSWQNTTGTDPTPLAATTFGKKVNWIAVGT